MTGKALIIDVRHNCGGNIDSWILGKLMRKAWMYWQASPGVALLEHARRISRADDRAVRRRSRLRMARRSRKGFAAWVSAK